LPHGRNGDAGSASSSSGLPRRWAAGLISRERAWLREYGPAWGTIGYAYVHLRRYHDATKWMKDWQQRNDLAPWMLLNLASACRRVGPDKTALAVNQRALKLPPDHTTPQHQLWIVLEIALLGDMPAVAERMAELREHELGKYEQALLALVKALRAVHEAQPTARRAVFAERRDDLARRYQQGAFTDPALNHVRRRTLAVLSRVSGDPWHWLRRWLPEFGGHPRPANHPTPSGGRSTNVNPRLIWVCIVLALGLLRTCASLQPSASTTNFRLPAAQTPFPYHPHPPNRPGEPGSFPLSPQFQQPVQLLPTPAPLELK